MSHCFPFRLVERSEAVEGTPVAVSLLSAGEFYSTAQPWPVSLVAEVLAQALLAARPAPASELPRLVGMNRVRLLGPVQGGDRLEVHVTELGGIGALRRFSSRAFRGGALVAEAEITVAG